MHPLYSVPTPGISPGDDNTVPAPAPALPLQDLLTATPFQRFGEGHNTSTGTNVGVAVMSIQKDRLDLVADTRRAAPNRPGVQQALRLAGITSGKRKQPRHCRERLLYTCREAPSLAPFARTILRNLLWKNPSLKKKTALVHLHRYHPSKGRRARTSECCLLLSTVLLPTTSPPPPGPSPDHGHRPS